MNPKVKDRYCSSGLARGSNRQVYLRSAVAGMFSLLALHASQAMAKDQVDRADPGTCTGMGQVWWNELLSPETQKLAEFYSKVVGWKLKTVDAEDQSSPPSSPSNQYTMFLAGNQEAAGMMKADHPSAIHSGVGWFTYIQVPDVQAGVNAAQASGGSVVREPFDNADGSRMAVVRDPVGNVFGLVTPGKGDGC